MSFGMTHAMVEGRVAELHRHAATRRTAIAPAGETRPHRGSALPFDLRNRIGLSLVELGLHLLVRARESTRPVPPQVVLLRRSSGARGR
jgi:hypothetical protein